MDSKNVTTGIIIVLIGLFVVWLGTPEPDDPSTPEDDSYETDPVCIALGIIVIILGIVMAVTGYRKPDAPPQPAHPQPVYPYPQQPMPPLYASPTICLKCGKQVPPNSYQCPYCGHMMSASPPPQQQPYPPQQQYAPLQPTPQPRQQPIGSSKNCVNCGQQISSTSTICPFCNHDQSRAIPPPP